MAETKDNGKTGGKTRRVPPPEHRFTPMNAKQAQEASVKARNLRKQMRARILQAAVDEGIDGLFSKAIKNRDPELLELVEKALKLTGLDFASSEESVQKLDIKSDNKNDNKVEIKVKGLGSDD